jgi:hypothetical protein
MLVARLKKSHLFLRSKLLMQLSHLPQTLLSRFKRSLALQQLGVSEYILLLLFAIAIACRPNFPTSSKTGVRRVSLLRRLRSRSQQTRLNSFFQRVWRSRKQIIQNIRILLITQKPILLAFLVKIKQSMLEN